MKKVKEKVEKEIKQIENQILKKIDGNKRTVAFVSYLLNCRNQVGNLHKKFKEAGFNVINIVNKRINDRFEKMAPTFVIPKQILTSEGIINIEVDFDFIDLIIAPDHEHITLPPYNEKFLSKRAKRLYLTHDILNGNAFDCFDYVFMPSMIGIKNHLEKNYRKGFCLIPGGYPKLDYSIEKYEKYKKLNSYQEDSILYAPTMRGQPVFQENEATFLIGFDLNILMILLKNFQEYIIFRPHPHDFNCGFYHLQIIKEFLKENSKIIFNYELKYLDKYLRSKLIVSDISDTIFTYAFTTLKPAISLIPYKYRYKSSIGGFNREFRHLIGYVVKTPTDLIDKINHILNNENKFKEKIIELREKHVCNVGKSADYLIENIEYILNDRRHPDWIYF